MVLCSGKVSKCGVGGGGGGMLGVSCPDVSWSSEIVSDKDDGEDDEEAMLDPIGWMDTAGIKRPLASRSTGLGRGASLYH